MLRTSGSTRVTQKLAPQAFSSASWPGVELLDVRDRILDFWGDTVRGALRSGVLPLAEDKFWDDVEAEESTVDGPSTIVVDIFDWQKSPGRVEKLRIKFI